MCFPKSVLGVMRHSERLLESWGRGLVRLFEIDVDRITFGSVGKKHWIVCASVDQGVCLGTTQQTLQFEHGPVIFNHGAEVIESIQISIVRRELILLESESAEVDSHSDMFLR